jgi:hypothetical protein
MSCTTTDFYPEWWARITCAKYGSYSWLTSDYSGSGDKRIYKLTESADNAYQFSSREECLAAIEAYGTLPVEEGIIEAVEWKDQVTAMPRDNYCASVSCDCETEDKILDLELTIEELKLELEEAKNAGDVEYGAKLENANVDMYCKIVELEKLLDGMQGVISGFDEDRAMWDAVHAQIVKEKAELKTELTAAQAHNRLLGAGNESLKNELHAAKDAEYAASLKVKGIRATYDYYLDVVREVRTERDLMLENLTAVQARCTALTNENRELKEVISFLRGPTAPCLVW